MQDESEITMSQLIQLTIDSIVQAVSKKRQYYVVVLKEQDKDRYVHIWTGPCEGIQIDTYRKGVQYNRPLTFDLMKTLVDLGDIHIDHVVINKVQGDLFFGAIAVGKSNTGNDSVEIDCRPSDAINLALRMKVPIFVTPDVIDKVGKVSPQVAIGMPVRRRRRREIVINVLVWTLFGAVLSWDSGGANELADLALYAPVGAVLGALQGLVEGVVVRAASLAILFSVVWGARYGWIGAIAGVILGSLVAVAVWGLGKALPATRRRGRDSSPSESA